MDAQAMAKFDAICKTVAARGKGLTLLQIGDSAALAGELEHLTFESVPGADHAYTHQREYVWDVVRRWLSKV